MHVVAEEPCGAPVETTCAFDQTIAIRLDFGHIVVGTNGHRAERPRMSVRDPLVIHRDVEKARGAERLARRLDLFQVPSKRFLPLVEAEDGLESRQVARCSWRMMRESVVQPMTYPALERLVKDSASTDGVELLKLGFELRHVLRRPLLDDGRVKAAELCHMKQRPGTFERCRRL